LIKVYDFPGNASFTIYDNAVNRQAMGGFS